MKMFSITQINTNQKTIKIRFTINKLEIRDIGLLLADQCANSPQHARIIADGHIQRGGVNRGVFARVPRQIKPAFGLVFVGGQRLAIDGMHHHTAATIGDAHKPLARQGLIEVAVA